MGKRGKVKNDLFCWGRGSTKRERSGITQANNKLTQLTRIYIGENFICVIPQYKINRKA